MGVESPANGYDAVDVSEVELNATYQTPFSPDVPEVLNHSEGAASRFEENQTSQPRQYLCSSVLLGFIVVMVLLAIVASPKPWYTLIFVLLSLMPAFPIARFILKNFQDGAVSNSFLLSQFLIGAVPLVLIASIVESFISAIIAVIVFNSQQDLLQLVLEDSESSELSDDSSGDEVLSTLAKALPLWKVLLFFLIVAFGTAGLVEEVGKWIVARRYMKLGAEEGSGLRVGCRGILASACVGALGFAATENMIYVLGIAQANRSGFSFDIVGLVLLRGLLAYPIHVGTQFYVAVSAAQRHVFSDPSSLALALLVAVLFHGTFDAVAFISMVLVATKNIPAWVQGLIPVFDIILIGMLLLLCRSRYKALLERERVLHPPSAV